MAAVAGRVLELLGSGDALPEDRDEDWARPARMQAADLMRQARHLAAEAALSTADAAAARDLARAAVATDSFDETAHRLLMSAQVALGEPARALATYERLRRRWPTSSGPTPRRNRALHLSILREDRRIPAVPAPAPEPPLAGRAAEMGRVGDAWHAANTARSALVLISGEAGIGKTRLAARPLIWPGAAAASSCPRDVTRRRVHCSYSRSSMRWTSTPPASRLRSSVRRQAGPGRARSVGRRVLGDYPVDDSGRVRSGVAPTRR